MVVVVLTEVQEVEVVEVDTRVVEVLDKVPLALLVEVEARFQLLDLQI